MNQIIKKKFSRLKQELISIDIIVVVIYTLLLALPASFEPNHFAKALLLGAIMHSFVYSIFLAWLSGKNKLLKYIIVVLLLLLCLTETFIYLNFNSRFNPNILTLIIQTTYNEANEFIDTFILQLYPLLVLVVLLILSVFVIYIVSNTKAFTIKISKNIKLSLLTIALFMSFIVKMLPLPFPIGENTIECFFESSRFVYNTADEVSMMKRMVDKINVKTVEGEETPVIVFVIGESFNKHHSSLYGYYLPTSKQLEIERDKGRLFVFNNAWTPTSSTNYAMRYIFTMKGCNEKENDSLSYVLMPAVFKKAGYTVSYLDNQYTRSITGILDYSCTYFLNPVEIHESCFDYRNEEVCKYDGEFVEKYKSYFCKEGKSLNIIHLMGQHFDVTKRYPIEYTMFSADDIRRPDLKYKKREIVAFYDNAVCYNDIVVSNIINEFRDVNAVVVYLSDHGEQIYDENDEYFGRQIGSFKDEISLKNVYQIPFLIWCSDKYISLNNEQYNAIKNAVDRKFCAADVSYLLFDLAGINFTERQKKYSIISSDYCEHNIEFQ